MYRCPRGDEACLDDCNAIYPLYANFARGLLSCAHSIGCYDAACLYDKCERQVKDCELYYKRPFGTKRYVGAHVGAAAGGYDMSGWGLRAGLLGEESQLVLEFGMGSFKGQREVVEHEGKLTRALAYFYKPRYHNMAYFRYGGGLGVEWLHHVRERELAQGTEFEDHDGAMSLPLRLGAGAGLYFGPVMVGVDALAGQHVAIKGDLGGYFEVEVRAAAGAIF